jgi:hypothetical protein
MNFRTFEKPHVIPGLMFRSKFLESAGLRAGLALARGVIKEARLRMKERI